MTRRLLGQLVREFWLQTVLGVGWAIYRTFNSPGEMVSTFIANFAGAFFLSSWAFGQYIRIRKQQHVEDEFQNVKGELRKLLTSLEQQTRYLIGHTTGGESIGFFMPTVYVNTSNLSFSFQNSSEYPVFDAFAEWIDLDEPIDPPKGKLWTRNRIVLGTIHPNKIALNVFGFDLAQRNRVRLNIFIHTRNRDIVQQVRVEKVNGRIKTAVQTDSNDFSQTDIPLDFPNYDPAQPKKVFL